METLFYYLPALEGVRDFLELGGTVLYAIAGLLLLMWTIIFERLFYLRTKHPAVVRNALQVWEGRPERKSWHAHQIRDEIISLAGQGLQQNLSLLSTCVALCPLMGLLGTVTGMVNVFEVMAVSGSGNPRSMASGVSMATVPTMAGMVAALSGVAMSAFLDRRAYRERELLAESMTMDH